MYKLSVVVLVYNTEEYLNECIDSLLSQKLDDIEIILVDDESTDSSLNICLAYQEKYDNIKVIQQKNQGGAVAGNNGLKIAKGEYVAIVDSDDIIPPNAYLTLYSRAKEVDADISIGKPLRLINDKLVKVALDREKNIWLEDKVIDGYENLNTIVYDGYYWNKIFKREFVIEFNIRMPEGYLYADRTMVHSAYLHAKKITISKSPCYYWRRRSSNAKSLSIIQNVKQLENFKERLRSFELESEIFKDKGNYIELIAIDSIYRLLFNLSDIILDSDLRDIYLTRVSLLFKKFEFLELKYLTPKEKLLFHLIKEKMSFELSNVITLGYRRYSYMYDSGDLIYKLPYFNSEMIGIPKDVYVEKILTAENIRNSQLNTIGDKLHFQCLIRDFNCNENLDLMLISEDEPIILPLKKYGDYYKMEVAMNTLIEGRKFYMVIRCGSECSVFLRKNNFEHTPFKSLLSFLRLRFTISAKYVSITKYNPFQALKKRWLVRGFSKVKT